MELSNLDFVPEQHKEIGSIPLPDEMPRRHDLSQIPKDILKSNTVENLISQNEDLMGRLKVALRRLSSLETENQKFNEETHRARLSQSASADQLLILKEKDQMWKARIDQFEKDKSIYTEKFRLLHEKLLRTSAELDRHHKYHERIKLQVKPYISQLKEYSKSQEEKAQTLTHELEHREAQLRDLRHQIIELTKNSRAQIEHAEKKNFEMIQFYETQIEKLSTENQEHKEHLVELEEKALRLHKALGRQDELENELVEMTRSKDDLRQRLEKEKQHLQERNNELSRHNHKLGIEHADLQVRVCGDQERLTHFEKENADLQDQLESLRYMWNAKKEECEKLRSGMSSLEKLNLELSQRINEIRQAQTDTK